MKITIARCVATINAAILAAGLLLGIAAPTTATATEAGGVINQESCVSSVEYACPPDPNHEFPVE